MSKSIYLIGSLRNPEIPRIANRIEEATGFECFADWAAPGPEADKFWRDYSIARGLTYAQALKSYAATHIFEFDKHHIDRCDIGVLVMPAGKSGHLELGYMVGQGKLGYILMDDQERWDIMVQFATVCFSEEELLEVLTRKPPVVLPPADTDYRWVTFPCGCATQEPVGDHFPWMHVKGISCGTKDCTRK